MGRGAFLLLAMTLVASGCAGPQTAAPPLTDTLEPHAPEPIASADQGSISGFVFDEELQPIAGARLELLELHRNATSAMDGGFTFNGLPAGPVSLVAGAIGYESFGRKVEVALGRIERLQVTLKTLPAPVPRAAHWTHDGYMELGVGTPVISPRPGTNNVLNWKHDVGDDLRTTLSSMAWKPTAAFSAARLRLVMDFDGKNVHDAPGASPIVVRLDDTPILQNVTSKSFFRHDVLVPVTCNPTTPTTCTSKPPNSIIDPVYGQRFSIYVSAFYLEPAAPDFSNLPDA